MQHALSGQHHTAQSASAQTTLEKAEFGMALPYFGEIVELKSVTTYAGSREPYREIDKRAVEKVFGEDAVVIMCVTVDGQAWRAIYPDGTSLCWVMPGPIARNELLYHAQ